MVKQKAEFKFKVNLSLMNYRATPLETGFSPAEILYGRKIRTKVPQRRNLFKNKWNEQKHKLYENKNNKIKGRIEICFNRRHKVKELPTLEKGEKVWITDLKRYGCVIEKSNFPRSYVIEVPEGKIRRNRKFLIPCSQRDNEDEIDYEEINILKETETINRPLGDENAPVDYNSVPGTST